MFNRRSMSLASLALACLAGCSAQERTTDPSPSETPFQAGNLTGATVGRVGPAQTTTGPGVTLTGLTGNFTRLSYQTGPAGGTSAAVYFSALDSLFGQFRIFKVKPDGSDLQVLTTAESTQTNPSISPSGQRLVFWQEGLIGGHATETFLTELHPDGSTTTILEQSNGITVPAWTPDEQSVLFSSNIGGFGREGSLVRINLASRTPETLLFAEADLYHDVTTGTLGGVPTAIFDRNDSLWQMNLTTLDTTFYFAGVEPSVGISHPRLSPDGTQILFWQGDNLYRGPTDHPEQATIIQTLPSSQLVLRRDAAWLRDGSGLIALLPEDTTNFSQLWRMSLTGTREAQLTHFPFGVETGISVGPAVEGQPGSVALLGEDGVLGNSASGIIFGQGAGGSVTAVVGFSSGRPRSVTLTQETGLNSNAPVLTYTLKADQLQTIRFIGDPAASQAVTVLDSTSAPAGGAIITFDAATGAVALILPFSANSIAPSVTDEAGTRVFRGDFLGVWKGGRNVGAARAGTVELDTRTGRVKVGS